jgi:excisionase family DNA binding protein
MNDKDEYERLFTEGFERVRDAARFLGLSVSQIYVLMNRRELPFAKFGKSRRIPRRALLDFAKRHFQQGQ